LLRLIDYENTETVLKNSTVTNLSLTRYQQDRRKFILSCYQADNKINNLKHREYTCTSKFTWLRPVIYTIEYKRPFLSVSNQLFIFKVDPKHLCLLPHNIRMKSLRLKLQKHCKRYRPMHAEHAEQAAILF
jgi:hypothetical protein